MIKRFQKPGKSFYIWGGIVLFSFIFYITGISHESLWCDEAFSAIMTDYSFIDIIKSAAADVHPPFYYILIKIFRIFLGNSEWALRLLSVFAATGMICLGAGPVRRLFGERTAYIYAAITLFTPIILIMGHEVRMYSPVIFTVTACALYGLSAVRENRTKSWVAFSIFTATSAYLHQYGLLAVTLINIFLGFFILVKKRELLKRYLYSAIPAALSYLPWAFVLLEQAKKVHKAFWIQPVNSIAIIETLFQPFYYKEFFPIDPPKTIIFIFAVLTPLFLTILASFIILAKKKEYSKLTMSLFLFSIYAFTFIVALVISFTLIPIFYRRYIIVCTGVLVLSFAIGINSFRHTMLRWGLVFIYILLNSVTIYNVYTKNFNGLFYDIRDRYGNSIKSGDLLITSDCFSTSTSIYYFPQADHFFYINSYEKRYDFIYDALEQKLIAEKDIKKALQKYQSFWYIKDSCPISVDPYTIINLEAAPGWECVVGPDIFVDPYSKISFSMYKFVYMKNNASMKTGNIKVHIKNIKNSDGYLRIILQKDKLRDISEAYKVQSVKVKGNEIEHVFKDIEFGNYAVIAIHDENSDGKFQIDENGIPEEGVGVFNYVPELGVNLKFDIIKFPLRSREQQINVSMGYPPFKFLNQGKQ